MNYTKLYNTLNDFEVQKRIAVTNLDKAKKNTERLNRVKTAKENSERLIETVTNRIQDLKLLQSIVKQEEVAFKERRLDYIAGSITEQLDYIFPKKDLKAYIDCNFERNNMKLRLLLLDNGENYRPPYLTEGKFAQQLISFSSAAACTTLLGKNILYLDESFSNGSQDNLDKTQKLLKSHVDKGFQIILISQSSVLFNDLPRREIHLVSDDGKFVNKVEYKDYLGGD